MAIKDQKDTREDKRKSQKIRDAVLDWLKELPPRPRVECSAAFLVGILIVVLGAYLGVSVEFGLGIFLDIVVSILASLLGYAVLYLLVKVVWAILQKIPIGYLAVIFAGFIASMIFFEGIPLNAIWFILLGIVLIEVWLGILAYEFLSGKWKSRKLYKRVIILICLTLVVGMNLGLSIWLVHPGIDKIKSGIEPYQGHSQVQANNPSEPGPYVVKELFYGSGIDRHRLEYSEDVDIVTECVDGSPYLWFEKWDERIREWYWGFGSDELPLNGRVWYPDGNGPFPLVLIVHGNHYMIDDSDAGYAYLGELLASRGYIVVSVDENFLNGYLTGSAKWENDARAWLLLKHLEIWHEWNQSPTSIFYGLVDSEQIALVGHSRGGEAVALAASFNRLSHYPDNANIRWNFHFNIQSVVAIAPVDQQYNPGGHQNQLIDVNYLILQGSHDADIAKYEGFRQYQRVSFNDTESNWFKTGLYIYNANHSQFNSVWGLLDFGPPRSWLLNRYSLLDPEIQRQIAMVYISAFLDATLKGNDEYIPIFEDYRNAGGWLPSNLYINQYEDAGYILVTNYEEDFDVTTTTIEDGDITVYSISRWKEDEMKFRTGKSQNNHAVVVGWNHTGSWYQFSLPIHLSAEIGLSKDNYVVFNLADGRGLVQDEDLLDFTVLIEDENGEQSTILLSEVNRLLPQLPVQFTKLTAWEDETYLNPTEAVFQSIRIPILKFMQVNPQFDIRKITKIRFIFNRSSSGTIILDDVGFDLN
jgi:hypothetical protein